MGCLRYIEGNQGGCRILPLFAVGVTGFGTLTESPSRGPDFPWTDVG